MQFPSPTVHPARATCVLLASYSLMVPSLAAAGLSAAPSPSPLSPQATPARTLPIPPSTQAAASLRGWALAAAATPQSAPSAAATPQSAPSPAATSRDSAGAAPAAPNAAAPATPGAPAAAVSTTPEPLPRPDAPVAPPTGSAGVPASPYDSPPAAAPNPPSYAAPATTPPAKPRLATLLDSGDYAFGGFAGVNVMYTRFAKTNATLVCGEGGLILDHALVFGGGGCGLVTNISGEAYGDAPHEPNDRLMFGYGGALVRYHFLSKEVANVAIGMLIGAGGITIGSWKGTGEDWQKDYTPKRSEAVFILEPQVGGYLNITRWFRVGASANYRLASGVGIPGLTSSQVGGPSMGINLHFGWF